MKPIWTEEALEREWRNYCDLFHWAQREVASGNSHMRAFVEAYADKRDSLQSTLMILRSAQRRSGEG